MKTLKNLFSAKNILIAVLIFASQFFIAGCDREDSNPIIQEQTEEITGEEAAEIIAKELSGSEAEYGAAAVCEDAAYIVKGGNVNELPENNNITGYTVNDSTIIMEDNIAPYTYYFELTYGYDFIKNGRTFPVWAPGIDSAAVRYSSDGTYAAPVGNGNRTAHTEDLIFSGLAVTSQNFVISGKYFWHSNSTASIGGKTLVVNGRLEMQDILIQKTTLLIVGGSGKLEMTVETNGGNSVAIDAEITFKSNSTAEITINGNTFTADLFTGEII
ncbi:MAG: hypothetical protein GXO87_09730 [Chlorobi bacterium]|nr:hypothetical protein [Chlorobiota bacterium]